LVSRPEPSRVEAAAAVLRDLTGQSVGDWDPAVNTNCKGKSLTSSIHSNVENTNVVFMASPSGGATCSTPPAGGAFTMIVTVWVAEESLLPAAV